MAQYFEDFGGQTNDTAPSNFTERWNTGNGASLVRAGTATENVGSKFLEVDITTDSYYLLSFDDVDSDAERQDSEVLFRVQTPTTPSNSYRHWAGCIMRGSGAEGTDAGGYHFEIDTADKIYIYKWVSDTKTQLATIDLTTFVGFAGGQPFVANEWIWVRARVNGSSQKMKVWRDHQEEPGNWTLEATDSAVTGDGWVGIAAYEAGITHAEFDYFSVATNGDTADFPALDATIVARTTQVPVEVLSSPTLPIARTTHVAVEVLTAPTNPIARVTTVYVEVLSQVPSPATSVDIEVPLNNLRIDGFHARVTR